MSADLVPSVRPLVDGHTPTDIGNAERLVLIANGQIRWVDTWGEWIVYDDLVGRWMPDTHKTRVMEYAKRVPMHMITGDAVRRAAELGGDQGAAEIHLLTGWAKPRSTVW